MRAAVADHAFDLGQRRAPAAGGAARLRAADAAARWYRAAPRPAGRSRPSPAPRRRAPRINASRRRLQPRRVVQFGQPGPAQQRPQRRIAERGPVEFGEMRVAAALAEQQRIADVVERRAVLSGRQRAAGGAGEILKSHRMFFPAARSPSHASRSARRPDLSPAAAERLKSLKSYPNSAGNTNVTEVTATATRFGRMVGGSREWHLPDDKIGTGRAEIQSSNG